MSCKMKEVSFFLGYMYSLGRILGLIPIFYPQFI